MKRSRRGSALTTGIGLTVGVLGVLLPLGACGGSPSSPTASQPAPAITVYEPGNGVSAPTPITQVRASYTPQAIAARIQGSVLLSVVVLADGTVGDVTVIRSLDTHTGWTHKP